MFFPKKPSGRNVPKKLYSKLPWRPPIFAVTKVAGKLSSAATQNSFFAEVIRASFKTALCIMGNDKLDIFGPRIG